jgi:superoxide dismutase, Fe-Mn family
MNLDRRNFISSATLAAGTFVGSQLLPLSSKQGIAFGASRSDDKIPLPELQPFPRKYEIKPLAFDPTKLKGLSAKLLSSHHENNYGGAVRNLAKVEAEIAKLAADAPSFALTALKQSEHAFRNSMVLHEMYFENLGGNGKVQGRVEKLISSTWGSLAKFETEFKNAGAGVGGGTGWVFLSWDLRANQPMISVTGHNNQFAAFSSPLLLMDVYEHAYAIEYGAKLKDYIEAFMANLQWEVVDRRLDQALALARLVRN